MCTVALAIQTHKCEPLDRSDRSTVFNYGISPYPGSRIFYTIEFKMKHLLRYVTKSLIVFISYYPFQGQVQINGKNFEFYDGQRFEGWAKHSK